jgi:DNA-binding GntR family transcriptional regulator
MTLNAIPEDASAFLTKGDLAYQILRREILRGVLQPGESLNQVDLAARIKMSTTPVREALNRLQADGLVISDGFRVFRVVRLNAEEARNIYESRIALDPYAAQLAAIRHVKEDAPKMRNAFAAYASDTDSMELHYAFHRAIYSSCGNDLLIGLLDSVWARSDRYRRFGKKHVPVVPIDERLEQHKVLLELVLAGKSTEVAEAMLEHVQRSVTTKTTEVLPASPPGAVASEGVE